MEKAVQQTLETHELAIDRDFQKQIFIDSWMERVKRPGVHELLAWLETTDFYRAPCSTRYHLSVEGGLLKHSNNVRRLLQARYVPCDDMFVTDLSKDETATIIANAHDFCKINFYTTEKANRKNELGKWESYDRYTVKDHLPYGHGEKSVLILSRFIKLTEEEEMAIRWHMGGFTPGMPDYSLMQAWDEACKKYPLVPLLHLADLEATHLLERGE